MSDDETIAEMQAKIERLHQQGRTMGLGTSRDVQRRMKMDKLEEEIKRILRKREAPQ